MKKFLFVSVLSLLTLSAWCQGNLQFNQVKLVGTTLETVPVGKVWKVESASYKGGTIQGIPNTGTVAMRFYVNDNQILLGVSPSGSYTLVGEKFSFPMWLPASSTLKAGENITYLSVIEYNIIP